MPVNAEDLACIAGHASVAAANSYSLLVSAKWESQFRQGRLTQVSAASEFRHDLDFLEKGASENGIALGYRFYLPAQCMQ